MILGWLWMLPLTLVGLAWTLVDRARYSHRSGGVLFFVARPGSVSAWWFRIWSAGAYTTGGVIVAARAEMLAHPGLMRHELAHVRQAMWLGVLMPVAYCIVGLVAVAQGGHFWTDNWFEMRLGG